MRPWKLLVMMVLDLVPKAPSSYQGKHHSSAKEMSTNIPTAQLAPIGQRLFQPLLAKLQRPELVNAQGFINGKWVEAHESDHFTIADPATDQEIARVVSMGAEDTRDAITAATTAQREWKKTTPPFRAKLLKDWVAAIAANTEDLAIIGCMECERITQLCAMTITAALHLKINLRDFLNERLSAVRLDNEHTIGYCL